MRKKSLIVGLTAILLMALVPGVAFAAGKVFEASGTLGQEAPGAPSMVPLSMAANEAASTNAMASGFFDGVSAALGGYDAPGPMTLGQSFTGRLDDSEYGSLKNSKIVVTQNSWFTFPYAGVGDYETVLGVSWGTFTLSQGKGNTVTGQYAATLTGKIEAVVDCPVDHPLVPGAKAFVNVVDEGMWMVDPGSATGGSFKKLSSDGSADALTVVAQGCAGLEAADITVRGLR